MINQNRVPKTKRARQATPLAVMTLTAAFGSVLTACDGGTNGGAFNSTDQSSVSVDQSSGFTVTPTYLNNVESITHIFGAFSAPCAIAPGQSATDQKCMTNVRETDAYDNEMDIKVNVPAGMCAYLEEVPYYYYNYQPGYGPKNYSINVTSGKITSCTVTNSDGTPAAPSISADQSTCTGDSGKITAGGGVSCAYDHSSNADAPNCCVGNYSASVFTTTVTTTGGVTTSTTTSSTTSSVYGGKLGSCIAGPGQSSLWPHHVASGTYEGYPTSVLIKVPSTGYAASLTTRVPIVYASGNNKTVSASNFWFDWSSYLSTGNAVTGAYPAAIQPSLLSTDALAVPTANDSWQFLCEDESREPIHRISLYVNEWDTNEQYALYKSSAGVSGIPSSPLNALDSYQCAVGGSIAYGYCNDFYSLRDYVSGSIGYFPNTPITDSAATTASN